MRLFIVVAFALLLSPLAFAQLNPKQVTEATFRIVQSGTLAVTGNVDVLNLSLYVPQEGVRDIKVTADSWSYAKDEYGNRIIVMAWKNPAGSVPYRIETTVDSKAKTLARELPVASDSKYLKENEQIRFTPALREAAFPYEKTLRRAAELTKFVHDYVHYDLSFVGKLMPSDWVYENRHGVCVEFSNLLAALLKINGIPTRYINGYAYSPVENKLVGHAWVEILLTDGSWVPLDATWLQAGYIDATHIVTSVRDDANQTQKLTYAGRGNFDVDWNRNEDATELMDYKISEIGGISLNVTDVPVNGYGLAKAALNTKSCTIAQLNITPCISDNGRLLDITNPERNEWTCGGEGIYWVYSVSDTLEKGFQYTCPVSVYDQTGSQSVASARITEERTLPEIAITGPDNVAVNERFELVAYAEKDFTFFSPLLGDSNSDAWVLSIDKPGDYKFYLFSNGALATKDVRVADRKEFAVSAAAPKNVTLGDSFVLSVTAENLLGQEKSARLRIDFDNSVKEKNVSFAPRETKVLNFNVTARTQGLRKASVSLLSDSITSYTASITVYKEERAQSAIDGIISALAGAFAAIAAFFGSLLG